MILKILLIIITLWILLCKLTPYLVYPNYFITSKTVYNPILRDKAHSLKSRNKEKTLYNIYNFMIKNFDSVNKRFTLEALFKLFKIPDYNLDKIIDKKEYFYCHTQNRLLTALLLNSGQFSEDQIKIKKELFKTFTIHQYVIVDFGRLK